MPSRSVSSKRRSTSRYVQPTSICPSSHLRQVESLEPIARGYNNKVYLLKLLPRTPIAPPALQPGCLPFPSQTPTSLIFRTVRKRSQTPPARKVLNAVATMQLVRESTDLPLAPMYGYDINGEEPWMLEGMLPGVPMDEAWQTADTDTRVRMLDALAVYACSTRWRMSSRFVEAATFFQIKSELICGAASETQSHIRTQRPVWRPLV